MRSLRCKRAWYWRKSACLDRQFLIGHTQQVKIGKCLSEQADTISKTIQGLVLGQIFYDKSIDSLMHSIKVKSGAFVDDLKLVTNSVNVTREEAQDDANNVSD